VCYGLGISNSETHVYFNVNLAMLERDRIEITHIDEKFAQCHSSLLEEEVIYASPCVPV